MQSIPTLRPCTAKKNNECCGGECPGYSTRSNCPPLIVIAMQAGQADRTTGRAS